MGQQGNQHFKGQKPAEPGHHEPLQPASPGSPRRGAGGGLGVREQEGWVWQGGGHHRPHDLGEEHAAGEGHQPPQGMAHQHGRPLHHLPQEGLQLPGPESVVES